MAQDRNQTSHRVGHDAPASGTAVGADTTARMSGTEQVVRPTGAHTGHSTEVRPAKTSAAAVFALVFGLAAYILHSEFFRFLFGRRLFGRRRSILPNVCR